MYILKLVFSSFDRFLLLQVRAFNRENTSTSNERASLVDVLVVAPKKIHDVGKGGVQCVCDVRTLLSPGFMKRVGAFRDSSELFCASQVGSNAVPGAKRPASVKDKSRRGGRPPGTHRLQPIDRGKTPSTVSPSPLEIPVQIILKYNVIFLYKVESQPMQLTNAMSVQRLATPNDHLTIPGLPRNGTLPPIGLDRESSDTDKVHVFLKLSSSEMTCMTFLLKPYANIF